MRVEGIRVRPSAVRSRGIPPTSSSVLRTSSVRPSSAPGPVNVPHENVVSFLPGSVWRPGAAAKPPTNSVPARLASSTTAGSRSREDWKTNVMCAKSGRCSSGVA